MPIQGGGKGKPGAGLASGAGAEPGAEAEAEEAAAAVVVAAPLGRERAALVGGGATASPELGKAGRVERGPWGATAGTCLEEREAGGPGGLQREDEAVKKGPE